MRTMPDRPNVILLTIDALRLDTMATFGGSGTFTPNLDRLAAESLRFTQAISGGSWTQAAFPVILTSSHAGQYGGCLGALSPSRPSPIASLEACGYHTIGISSNPWLSRYRKYHRGFTVFRDLQPVRRPILLRRVRGGQTLLRTPVFHRAISTFGFRLAPPKVYSAAPEIGEAIFSTLSSKPERPYFLWAHYMDTHWPYHLDHALVKPEEIAGAWRDIAQFHDESWNGFVTTPDQLERYKQLYNRALQFLDNQIRLLIEKLQEAGLLENTVMMILADHGEEFLDHGQLGHLENNLHDEILRVPFFIRFPDGGPAGTFEGQVRLLDVMPTVLDLCGCQSEGRLEGRSLAPIWSGAPETYHLEYVIAERPRPDERMIAVRTEGYKYIWRLEAPQQPSLYDLSSDPLEKENLAGRMPDLAARKQAIVDAHLDLIRETDEDVEDVEGERLDERLRDLGYLA